MEVNPPPPPIIRKKRPKVNLFFDFSLENVLSSNREVNMRRLIVSYLIFIMASMAMADIKPYAEKITRRQIQSVLEFISDDLFEGRAPGTRGGELVEKYIRSVFKLLDIEPSLKDYFQSFTLKGFTLQDLTLEANGLRFRFREDVVGTYTKEETTFELEGDAVFAGYGIVSPSWAWDDYKGQDVRGKILIIRVNEPGRNNPALFRGRELTYYGRWIYKLEEAARHGAKGVLLIHTRETAGYGWTVVRNSWGGESLYLPQSLKNPLIFRGWIREEALKKILKNKGINLDELYRRSEKRDFSPVNLGFKIKIKGKNRFRTLKANNVVGFIPGSDPMLKKKYIVLSAHIDHLGKNPNIKGDNIFNGAIDNASAVSSMIITAKVLKEYQKHLKYSVIVLACQAEEEGLLGSLYFSRSIDPSRVVLNINFESTPVWEKSRDFMGIGAKYSTLEDILKKILRKEGLKYSYFSMSEQGFFYRSDQFSFARRGIPAVWLSAGEGFVSGRNRIMEFFTGNYHTPKDEYDPNWPLESTLQTIKIALLLVDYINQHSPKILWKGKMTFPVER